MATSRASPVRPPVRLAPTDLQQAQLPPRTPSPNRRALPNYQTLDPLLGKLSPESTLKALSFTHAVPNNEKVAHDILSKSISQVSPAERALGIRAAVAAQNLGLWYKEVQSWDWPKRTDIHLGKGFIPPADTDFSDPEYYGSLPAAVVAQHEKRIEEIRDEMDSLDVDELKEHVLNAHIPSRSRPSSSNSTLSVPPPLSYVQLSDFTAVITATILRALPLLSRLNTLLSTWDVRLLVLREISGLLRSLHIARSELDSALKLLTSSDTPTEKDALYSRTNYHSKRTGLEATVLSAGRRMDRILDALEGREDSLPENWIDELETIEADFGTWVMDAEKRTVANEWQRQEVAAQREEKNQSIQAQPNRTPELVVHEPELICQPGRPLPMETIDEEPGSPLNPMASPVSETGRTPTISEVATPATHEATPDTTPEMNVAPSLASEDDSEDDTESHSPDPETVTDTKETNNTVAPTPADINPPIEVIVDGPSPVIPEEHPEVVPDQDVPGHTDLLDESPSPPNNQEALTSPVSQEKTDPALSSPEGPQLEQQKSPREPEKKPEELLPESENAIEVEQSLPQVDGPSSISPSPERDIQPSLKLDSQEQMEEVPSQKSTSIVEISPSLNDKPELDKIEPSQPVSSSEDCSEDPSSPSSASNEPPAAGVPCKATNPTTTTTTETTITTETPTSVVEHQAGPPSVQSTNPLPGSPKPSPSPSPSPDRDQKPATSDREEPDEARTSKQPLESPIKLSKTRPGRLDLEKEQGKPRGRRTSNDSAGSFSDYPSLISSPEIREQRIGSSNGTPRLLETPPQFHPDYRQSGPTPSNNDHTLREDRLFRLDNQKSSPRTAFKQHNRNLSLPLQRFINERLDLDYGDEAGEEMDSPSTSRKAIAPSAKLHSQNERPVMPIRPPQSRPSAPITNVRRLTSRFEATREESPPSGPDGDGELPRVLPKTRGQPRKPFVKNTNQDTVSSEPVAHSTTARLRKQLTAHPSLESIGAYKSKSQFTEGTSAGSTVKSSSRPSSRPSTPSSQMRKPKDHLDEKISTILTTLPTRIQLMSAEERELDGASVTSAAPLKARERFRSISPQGTPSRSGTPAPSLTLTPAVSRRRNSHAHAPEERSVKLYHLHRGGKSAPTKLFVRAVGENGERVMVRVGGGWADLAEYLKEYAIHHGRRHIAETPRVEVQELSTRETTPNYSPGNHLTPSANGRTTPSRPQSVMSNRPSSSLAVRKTRRSSNVSDMTEFRTVSAGESLNPSFSPKSTVSSRRRLSVSSNASAGAASFTSEIRRGSSSHSPSTTVGGSSHSIPLGLAGPKPRSRHVSMTPESEAWVEDVLGQARRSSSLRPVPYGPGLQEQEHAGGKTPTLPKSRSISDLGKAGGSKRVALRGLGNR